MLRLKFSDVMLFGFCLQALTCFQLLHALVQQKHICLHLLALVGDVISCTFFECIKYVIMSSHILPYPTLFVNRIQVFPNYQLSASNISYMSLSSFCQLSYWMNYPKFVVQDSWRDLANAFANEKILFLLNTAHQVTI